MKILIKLIGFVKTFLFLLPVTLILHPFTKLILFTTHLNLMLVWIMRNKSKFSYRESLSFTRDYKNRYHLYKYVSDQCLHDDSQLLYLEFGVAGGESFQWWIGENSDARSRFYGFDTFEGLPEKWGVLFKKGDMSYQQSHLDDTRATFVKGLFQDTLCDFISQHREQLGAANVRKVIHMDADLYSSTLFVLSQLYPYLHAGDVILFDEFNVPLHEFKAFREFTASFYVPLQPLGAVNNYLQTAFLVG